MEKRKKKVKFPNEVIRKAFRHGKSVVLAIPYLEEQKFYKVKKIGKKIEIIKIE